RKRLSDYPVCRRMQVHAPRFRDTHIRQLYLRSISTISIPGWTTSPSQSVDPMLSDGRTNGCYSTIHAPYKRRVEVTEPLQMHDAKLNVCSVLGLRSEAFDSDGSQAPLHLQTGPENIKAVSYTVYPCQRLHSVSFSKFNLQNS